MIWFRILKKCGTDMIRLRIWPDPYDASGAPYGGGNNDLQTTVELAQRAKSSGMEVLLDFQYSDFWADPAKQIKPKAWKSLTGKELEAAVYLHTRETLKYLKTAVSFLQWFRSGTRSQTVFYGRVDHVKNLAANGRSFTSRNLRSERRMS